MHFSDWFGDSMKTIRAEAEKKHPGALNDLLESVVEKVDEMLDSNEDVESRTYQQFIDEGLIKCFNKPMLMNRFKTLSQETLNKAFSILDQLLIKIKEFKESTRKFEEKYTGELFYNRMATVKDALIKLATFATKNPSAADIETERIKVQNSILQPLSDALNHESKDKYDEELIQNIKKALILYSVSEEKGQKDLFELK